MKTRSERRDRNLTRKSRVSYKVSQNRDRFKLYVYRSNRYIYAQIIDNEGKAVLGVSSRNIADPEKKKGKVDISFKTGSALAEKAKAKKITEVVFNRGSFKYHGRVKALAEGARKGGLKF